MINEFSTDLFFKKTNIFLLLIALYHKIFSLQFLSVFNSMNVTLRHFITNRSTDHFASKTLMTRDEEILYFCICFHTYCMITEELLELTLQSVCPHYVS